jgi:Uma2 family endonuclease
MMVIAARPMTAREFAALEDGDTIDELLKGTLIQMPPPGARHGRL